MRHKHHRRNQKLLRELGIYSGSAGVRGIAKATTDTERYGAATDYAQKLGLNLSRVTAGPASKPALKEFGQSREAARRKKLQESLARRTTTSSRKHAMQRMMTQYGVRATDS